MKFQTCLKHYFRNLVIWQCFKWSGSFLYVFLLIAPSSHFPHVSTNTVLVLRLTVTWAWFWCKILPLQDIEEDCFSGHCRALLCPPFDSERFFKWKRRQSPPLWYLYFFIFSLFFLLWNLISRSACLEKHSNKYGFKPRAGIRKLLINYFSSFHCSTPTIP